MPNTRTDAQHEITLASPPWRCQILTLFPEMFPGPLGYSLVGTALSNGLWTLDARQIRDHGIGKHRIVDDSPAGGGAGMVMRADVIAAAVDAARAEQIANSSGHALPAVYMTPRGRPLTQERVRALAHGPGVLLLAGRFEGVDQRVIEGRNFEEISIGDYILSGGELAAMALLDACVRLLPGVLGGADSLIEESFDNNLLEYPQYTRPRTWENASIPDVLLSGDHKHIAQWRHDQALAVTGQRRPDLLAVHRTSSTPTRAK